jgi:CDP-glucose 4,6-dehydratase
MKSALNTAKPDIVIHMAAQSLVIEGYQSPVVTYASNVMGTVNLLEAIRSVDSVQAGLMITTDKCYENKESDNGYSELDRLGGYDPYSNSKACAELVVSSFRDSYFSKSNSAQIASLRAGNVIGGGDWSENRLVPDCVRAFTQNQKVELRSPKSIRPWQHVLEPLSGYLLLAEKLFNNKGQFNGAWNFGPNSEGEVETLSIAQQMAELWGGEAKVVCSANENDFIETGVLRLDSSKAKQYLNWQPKWDIRTTLEKTVDWYQQVQKGRPAYETTVQQVDEYLS